ncbi:hypothetical protein LCGC14_2354280 [marine sediment metagenome]|uniref:Uncharacterized protein n=1 Tax=marine sediment metagenome TaxID=412755 RepID=A0A0F9F379_9ZZZZ
MLKVTGQISSVRLNSKRYHAAVLKRLDQEHKNAVAAWVKAVAYSIPVYTGTARGTIAPVGRTVRQFVGAAGTNEKTEFVYQGKTYPLGFRQGKNYQEHSLSRAGTEGRLTFTFRFLETLPYVVWNTSSPAPAWMNLKNITPWYAIQKGVAAYVQYAREQIPKRLPRLTLFEKVTIVRVL